MNRTDFEKELVELDRDFEREAATPGVDARLRAKLAAPEPRQWFRPVLVVVLAVALISFGLALWPRSSTLGGFATLEASKDFEARVAADQRISIQHGEVTLVDDGQQASLQLGAGAEVKRVSSGAEVFEGTVRFEVAHRTAQSYSVRVSGGVIEVVGTRFTIVQRGPTGEVKLEQGVIRFHGSDGREVTLAPGESVSWPPAPSAVVPEPPVIRPVAPVVPVRPVAPVPVVPVKPTAPAFSVEAVLSQVASLRSRGEFEEAVSVLSKSLSEPMPSATRERLSFELGSILSHQLHDSARACAHWRSHVKSYPEGRYQQAVSNELTGLKCEKEM